MPRQIRIVLVEPSHPGNIGAAARAMKTMALDQLVLVRPAAFPHPEASARASGAGDLLQQARIADSLVEALAGCVRVAGTSARARALGPPPREVREGLAELLAVPADQDVAVVFGRERTGLSNEELDLCHVLLHIPANPQYRSLNLAAAVQVVAYELYRARCPAPPPARAARLATAEAMEGFYAQLEAAAIACGFLDPARPGHLMRRLRLLFNRARPERREIDILRGLLAALSAASRRPAQRAKPEDDVPV